MTWSLAGCLLLMLVAVLVATVWLVRRGRSRRAATICCGLLAALVATAAVLADLAQVYAAWHLWVAVAVLGSAAVVVGAAASVAVLALADREAGRPASPVRLQALRGGAWIGVLERAGIFASLASGYPEGVALILAIKGLARYPELRAGQQSGVAERFIIGTLTSMSVAAACAGILRLLA